MLASTGLFPPSARLHTPGAFTRVHETGVRAHTKHFTLVIAPGAVPEVRLGMTVSRKVGNAVVRNRLRRLLREVFRRCRGSLLPVDVVIIARPEAATLIRAGLTAVSKEILAGLRHARATK